MIVREFCSEVARREGKKKQVTVAQISEIVCIMDKMLGKKLYPMIRSTKTK